MSNSVYVVSAVRTPIGSFLGSLSSVPGPRLAAAAIKTALHRAHVLAESVDEVILGNVVSAGIGQAPARQAAIFADVPSSVPATTLNKVCGSGMQAILFGTKSILLGDAQIALCGGFESMSSIPYYLPKARTGYRMGTGEVVDGMVFDGLWDPYNNQHMGMFGEKCAAEFGFTREKQDAFAAQSYRKAQAAQKDGKFDGEMVIVNVPQPKGDPVQVSVDEEPGRANLEKMGKLRPAFAKDGTITAANASKINDGASVLVLASEQAVKEKNLTPVARIVGYGGVAQAPEWFTTAPAAAIEKTLARLKLSSSEIDLWEINEAFSAVTLHAIQHCKLDADKVNIHGGAVALGHPIGCSGARITTTLIHALIDRKLKRGLATLCIGGGEALALVVERV